jgi:trehalose 6-phosphate phosphatase
MHPEKLLPLDLDDIALLLDIDGTLLDFAPTPREVWVPTTLRKTLAALHERTGGATALVSGRSLNDIDLIFSPLELPAVGGHGAEIRPHAGGESEPAGLVLDKDLKRKFAQVAALSPGILLEDKGYSLALHYRLAPKLEDAVLKAVARICADLPPAAIEVLPGKFVVEIKSAGVSKALAVEKLMTIPPFAGRRPIFIGDDVTDETVFPVVPEFDGLGFSVGRTVPGNDGCFKNPEDVRRWLDALLRGAPHKARHYRRETFGPLDR